MVPAPKFPKFLNVSPFPTQCLSRIADPGIYVGQVLLPNFCRWSEGANVSLGPRPAM